LPGVDFGGSKVIPIVTISDAAKARDLGRALVDGGLTTVEVTLRTPAGLAAVALLAQEESLFVGAGTVLTEQQVDLAVAEGAQYILSPGLSPEVVHRCQEHRIPVIPGVATATEIMRALELGVDVVKFFPAEQLGGPAGIRALAGPFPGVRFLPTGGVTVSTLSAYLEEKNVIGAGMSWVAPADLIEAEDWAEISRRAAEVS
jgi:2-dehydro-3-deoxyphosphogluconate aldolase / (4S)-4-hydroxy-2-oxoglutarate aldolase